ncbi:MAG: 50S ribosomal protein L24 [Candidatus Micrarchaeota archaeon]
MSSKPGKQRKARAQAKLHERQKFVTARLGKELRAKSKKKKMPVRKGDSVKVVRGKFKKKTGKVTRVNLKNSIVFVEGCLISKQGGKEVQAPLQPSNLIITALVDRRKAFVEKKEEPKKEPVKKEEAKTEEREIEAKTEVKKDEEKPKPVDKKAKAAIVNGVV